MLMTCSGERLALDKARVEMSTQTAKDNPKQSRREQRGDRELGGKFGRDQYSSTLTDVARQLGVVL